MTVRPAFPVFGVVHKSQCSCDSWPAFPVFGVLQRCSQKLGPLRETCYLCKSLELSAEKLVSFQDRELILFLAFMDATVHTSWPLTVLIVHLNTGMCRGVSLELGQHHQSVGLPRLDCGRRRLPGHLAARPRLPGQYYSGCLQSWDRMGLNVLTY